VGSGVVVEPAVVAALVLHHPSLAHKFSMLVEAEVVFIVAIILLDLVLRGVVMVVDIMLTQHQAHPTLAVVEEDAAVFTIMHGW
jgi:hypothetical protein